MIDKAFIERNHDDIVLLLAESMDLHFDLFITLGEKDRVELIRRWITGNLEGQRAVLIKWSDFEYGTIKESF